MGPLETMHAALMLGTSPSEPGERSPDSESKLISVCLEADVVCITLSTCLTLSSYLHGTQSLFCLLTGWQSLVVICMSSNHRDCALCRPGSVLSENIPCNGFLTVHGTGRELNHGSLPEDYLFD